MEGMGSGSSWGLLGCGEDVSLVPSSENKAGAGYTQHHQDVVAPSPEASPFTLWGQWTVPAMSLSAR